VVYLVGKLKLGEGRGVFWTFRESWACGLEWDLTGW
jgi:hypothetical protein